MAQRRPIVLRNGRLTELPAGDSLPGVGFDPSALPAAGDLPPQAFIVQQGGQWVLASYTQMASWFAGAQVPEPAHEYGLLSEVGELLLTESGGFLSQENSPLGANTHILDEFGRPLLSESNEPLTQETV